MKTFALTFAATLLSSMPVFSAPPENRSPNAPRTRLIERKLNGIVVPHLDLRNVTVEEAFAILQQKSKQLDPDGVGVNFVLKIPGAPAAQK